MLAPDVVIFVAVVLVRLLLPLLMPRYPLPVIVACLVVDGVDQTVFQQFTSLPLDNYQSYDKALDIYYLSIAYITTLRNWTNHSAYLIAFFLLFYRLVGVAIFEAAPPVDDASPRWLLLVFPNTFEYFFIAYEGIRMRWDPRRLDQRFLLLMAAGIWIVVKLPQEYWIHIAQLDTTDLIRAHPWVGVLIGVGLLALALVARYVVWPRTPQPDHALRLGSDPVPDGVRTSGTRHALRRGPLATRLALVTLITFIFGSIFPGVELSLGAATVWVATLIAFNVAISLWAAGQGWTVPSLGMEFAILSVLNLGFVLFFLRLLGRGPGESTTSALVYVAPLFFVMLLTLVGTLMDRYRPVHDFRFHPDESLSPRGRDASHV